MDGGGGDYRKMMKLKREGGGEGEIFTYYLFPCSGLTCALFREGGGGRGGEKPEVEDGSGGGSGSGSGKCCMNCYGYLLAGDG